MPEVLYSVVVVSWNVAERLRACLASLERERTAGASLEVLVVDNASHDGSAQLVERVFPKVKLLRFPENKGFAAACNLAVREAQGAVVVLINPDAEVAPGFFAALGAFLAQHPKVAVVGGAIEDAHGQPQPSVRGFPTVWSSMLDGLKLLRQLPWLTPRYLAGGFDYSKAQPVAQVMGACFAVRREVWNQLQGFDERFFTWFEEVDFCKRAHEAGLEVWYAPAVKLWHVGGASFAQLRPLARHRLFSQSLGRYARKHFNVLGGFVVAAASTLGYLPALAAETAVRLKRAGYAAQFAATLLGFALFDVLSWYAWRCPAFGSVAALLIGVVWLALANRNIALGVVLLATELIIGSEGYLLSLKVGQSVISLRLILFLTAFALLIWRTMARRKLAVLQHPLKWWYAGALAAVAWGALVALLRGSGFADLFLDINGYFYLGLFPLFIEAAGSEVFTRWCRALIYPGLTWLALKTLGALYLFSHVPVDSLVLFYQWWRQTGFGEITYVTGNVFRIFSQSQIYAALATTAGFVVLVQKLRQGSRRHRVGILAFLLTVSATLLASLSRSFWLGVASAWGALLLTLITFGRNFKVTTHFVVTSAVIILASAGLFLAVTRLPWPIAPLGQAEAKVFAERLQGEAASASRLRLLTPLWQSVQQHLVVGSGFGATVTYFSLDPRAVHGTAGGSGLTTTYAFEWGYLDAWLKLGLIGFVPFLAFLLACVWYTLRRAPEYALALAALLVLNMTTPYLNHPLGFGAIMLAVALAAARPLRTVRTLLW